MDEDELVQRYLHQEFHQIITQLHRVFERYPALAVRMVRSELELFERLSQAVADNQAVGDAADLDDMEQLLRDRLDDNW